MIGEFSDPPEKHPTKLSDRTTLSLHLVAIIVMLTIWLVRMEDRVKSNSARLDRVERGLNHFLHPKELDLQPANDAD